MKTVFPQNGNHNGVNLIRLLKIIATLDGYVSLAFLAVQQAVVAGVVYLSVVIAEDLSAGTLNPNDLYLLVILNLCAFFPGLISGFFFRRWTVGAASRFWSE